MNRVHCGGMLFGFVLAAGAGAIEVGAQERTIAFSIQTPGEAVAVREAALPGPTRFADVTLELSEPTARTSQPGFPMLPYYTRQVAVPQSAQLLRLSVRSRQTERRALPGPLVWAQRPQMGQQDQGEPTPPAPALYYPAPNGVDLDPRVLQSESWPSELARVAGVHTAAGYDVFTLEVLPVRWLTSAGSLEVHTVLEIEVTVGGGTIPPTADGYAAAMALSDLRARVVNPADLPPADLPSLGRPMDAWYLVITDNYIWTSDHHRGAALDGDVVGQFQRLADWKTAKGIKAEVVTISDIVDGRYGNFTAGSRDLPETLRRFLRHAVEHFDTYWVLLGGDVEVVPPRYVTAAYGGNCGTAPKPAMDHCSYHADTQTIRLRHGGDRGTVVPATVIFTHKNARGYRRVSGPSVLNPGWAYATSDSYAVESSTPTEFVMLRGPTADLTGTNVYLNTWPNTIPTDLYYASLSNALVAPGTHPWDRNDDGFYGQFNETGSLDGVDYWPTVTLGRAPVSTTAEATAFVDKVLAYEKYEVPSPDFARRTLFISSNWGGQPGAGPGTADPPTKDHFFHAPGSTTAKVHFQGAPLMPSRLIAWKAPGDWVEVPYSFSPSGGLTYHFATDESYAMPSVDVFLSPISTALVTVSGPSSVLGGTTAFFFNLTGADGSLEEKERIKSQLAAELPTLDLRERLYQDLLDAPDYPAADLLELTEARVKAALNAGYNVVTLSGHGNWNGCCGLAASWAGSLTNGFAGGLAYADSCLTNQFDVMDAVGETLVTSASGGLAAYVGNSRFSWIGRGHDLEKLFWHRLTLERQVGHLHNSKALLSVDMAHQWANFALTLNGDPEMSLWVSPPKRFGDVRPTRVWGGHSFSIRVHDTEGAPVGNAHVAVTGPQGLFLVARTDGNGAASFVAPHNAAGSLLVTLTATDYVPAQLAVQVGR